MNDNVLGSKSFWSSVFGALVMILVTVFPQFQGNEDALIDALTVVTVALVVGHKGKDIAVAFVNALIKRTSIQDELNTEETPVTIS